MYAENRLHEYKQLTFTSAFVILSDSVQISSRRVSPGIPSLSKTSSVTKLPNFWYNDSNAEITHYLRDVQLDVHD